jgi:hypothetical protein
MDGIIGWFCFLVLAAILRMAWKLRNFSSIHHPLWEYEVFTALILVAIAIDRALVWRNKRRKRANENWD